MTEAGAQQSTSRRRIVFITLFIFAAEIFFPIYGLPLARWLELQPDLGEPNAFQKVVGVLFSGGMGGRLNWIRQLLFVLLGLFWAHRMKQREVPAELGLAAHFPSALVFAVLATIPYWVYMAVGHFLRGPVDLPVWTGDEGRWTVSSFLHYSVLVPFASTVLWYGYAFRQLQARAGWKWGWAVLALVLLDWGASWLPSWEEWRHWYDPLGGLAGRGLLTGVTAWVFVKWRWNLWVLLAMDWSTTLSSRAFPLTWYGVDPPLWAMWVLVPFPALLTWVLIRRGNLVGGRLQRRPPTPRPSATGDPT